MTLESIKKLKAEALLAVQSAGSSEELEALRLHWLGRNGELTKFLRTLKDLSLEQKRTLGAAANHLAHELEESLSTRSKELNVGPGLAADLTLPGIVPLVGHAHPLRHMLERIENYFTAQGYAVIEGPEVESVKYNFDLLNIPKDHPARDLWDTFYLKKNNLVLRTHTSPMQLRYMEHHRPPVRVIVPGRVYRREATDASHEAQFFQCEGLVIDRGIRVTDLIGTLTGLLKNLFGGQVKVRVRPHYYPFVEPGMDMDMSCLICSGQGCSVCKGGGWLEMLGSGMVHPVVLKNMRVDPAKYSGFAFGLGVDRLMMLYEGVGDIRFSYTGDLNFLEQFSL